jgi:hypothetical protein
VTASGPASAPVTALNGLPSNVIRLRSGRLDALLLSDLHVGAAGFDEPRLKADLAYAGANGLRVLVNGDVFDAIVTRDHKRYEPTALHPRVRGTDDIAGASLDWAEALLAPHADLIDLISPGNHETSYTKHHSCDLARQLVQRLNRASHAADVRLGGYAGLLRYEAPPCKGKGPAAGFTIFHWHGAGGGGRGSLLGQFAAKGQWVEGADLCWFGHLHGLAIGQARRLGLDRRGRTVSRPQWQVRTPSYLDGYREPGYASAALHDPYPTGCVRLTWDAASGESIVSAVSAPPPPPVKRTGRGRGRERA